MKFSTGFTHKFLLLNMTLVILVLLVTSCSKFNSSDAPASAQVDNQTEALVNLCSPDVLAKRLVDTGIGIKDAPYIICTLDHLNDMRNFLPSEHFVLGQDIDAAPTKDWENGSGWLPLFAGEGNASTIDSGATVPAFTGSYFSGSFDGRGFTISNLFINRPTYAYAGLFAGLSEEGSITRLNLTNAVVTGNSVTGVLAGQSCGLVSNVTISGSVTGMHYVGMLSGAYGIQKSNAAVLIGCTPKHQNSPVGISKAVIAGAVTGIDFVGGVVGTATGDITEVEADVTVMGRGSVGGVAGNMSAAVMTGTRSSGSVSGVSGVGGLCGHFTGQETEKILQSSSSMAVSATSSDVGGLVGASGHNASILSSFSTGNVTGNTNVGGIVGRSTGGLLNRVYSTGNITAGASLGGILGQNDYPGDEHFVRIDNCYVTGTLRGKQLNQLGNQSIGGLVGSKIRLTVMSIKHCYFAGSIQTTPIVTGGVLAGSAIGFVSTVPEIESVFIDGRTQSGLPDIAFDGADYVMVSNIDVAGVSLETGSAMTDSPYALYKTAGWDFTNIWQEPSSSSTSPYPQLR